MPPARATPLVMRVNHDASVATVMVRGTLDGHAVRFAVDTGSSGHLLAAWTVRRFALGTSPSGHVHLGMDGSAITTPAVDHAAITLDGWGPIGEQSIDAVDLPPDFEALGIGGLISPQRLATEGSDVVLDFVSRSMSLRSRDDANALLSEQAQSLIDPPLERCPVGDGGWLFITPGTVEGATERLLVDTGSTNSVVLFDSEAGGRVRTRARPDRDPVQGLSGSVTTQTVPGVEVAIGAVRRSAYLELRHALPQPCPIDGTLGLDVLQGCVLAIGMRGMRGRCSAE